MVWLLGCGSTPTKQPGADSAGPPSATACRTDTGGGYPTWAGFGEGFFLGRCAACHAATAPDRFGAPEGVTFDTADDVYRLRDSVRRTVLTDHTMPPGGGLLDEELERLDWYLSCLEEEAH